MMKRFKLGLVGIVLGLFGFINFSNAGYITTTGYANYLTVGIGTTGIIENACFFCQAQNGGGFRIYDSLNNQITNGFGRYQMFCFYGTSGRYENNGTSNYGCFTLPIDNNECEECPECETCPEIDTGSILSGSCDTNYCVENDLCPVPSNFSQLFINDIEHQSASLINITIPEEYNWDSSVNSGQFDLIISGYNVDYEYIDGIIRTQKFTPDEEDFNSIITQVIPLLVPGLVIILFIWFIFRFIKKIF